jgi:hypothetical protein
MEQLGLEEEIWEQVDDLLSRSRNYKHQDLAFGGFNHQYPTKQLQKNTMAQLGLRGGNMGTARYGH